MAPFGYHKCKNTPGLWYHETKSITFTLVVDNFGVKYVDKSDVEHLISSLKANYGLTVDWTGNLYYGISLEWDYVNRWVDMCKNTAMSSQTGCKCVRTHLNQKKLDPKHRLPFFPMHHQN